MRNHLARLAILLILAVPSRAAVTAPADVPFVLTRLELDLRVDYEAGTIGGTATLQVRSTASQPRAAIPLVLGRLMTVSKVTDAAGASLTFGQKFAIFLDDPTRQVNFIVITPPQPVSPGASFTATVHYSGVLVGYTETGSLYIQDHVSHDFTIIREDAYAFPTLGVPSEAANHSAQRDDFAFSARITVPSDQIVAMGGKLQERSPHDSLITWSYHNVDHIPFLNITIAPYQQLDRPGAHIFYFPTDAAGARALDQAISSAVDRFTRWFGSLGREPHLVIMEIPERFGSQGSLSAGIMQTADAFRDKSELPQVYHELSHLWNVSDLEHPSPRWNEGLAMFLQLRMAAELDGWNKWDARLERSVGFLKERCGPPNPCDAVPMSGYGKAGLTDRSYSVGMLMFYALYQVLGQEAFDRAYGGFFQQHREKGGTTADLVAAFRKISPKCDPVFQDWLFTTRWYSLLSSGKTFSEIVEGYKWQDHSK